MAPGIVFYSTPSHGGIHLSPERQAVVKKLFPDFRPFNDWEGWYEEDCDCVIVFLSFLDILTPEKAQAAIVTAKALASSRNTVNDWSKILHWINSPMGATVRALAE